MPLSNIVLDLQSGWNFEGKSRGILRNLSPGGRTLLEATDAAESASRHLARLRCLSPNDIKVLLVRAAISVSGKPMAIELYDAALYAPSALFSRLKQEGEEHKDEIQTLRLNLKEAQQDHQNLEYQIRQLRSLELNHWTTRHSTLPIVPAHIAKKMNFRLSLSTIFAVASILEGGPFVNGTPQNTDLAERDESFIGGDILKSGQTKFKSFLAEFLVNAQDLKYPIDVYSPPPSVNPTSSPPVTTITCSVSTTDVSRKPKRLPWASPVDQMALLSFNAPHHHPPHPQHRSQSTFGPPPKPPSPPKLDAPSLTAVIPTITSLQAAAQPFNNSITTLSLKLHGPAMHSFS
ncbi:hypothetical protein JOM56_005654 [Amanita muscaria]